MAEVDFRSQVIAWRKVMPLDISNRAFSLPEGLNESLVTELFPPTTADVYGRSLKCLVAPSVPGVLKSRVLGQLQLAETLYRATGLFPSVVRDELFKTHEFRIQARLHWVAEETGYDDEAMEFSQKVLVSLAVLLSDEAMTSGLSEQQADEFAQALDETMPLAFVLRDFVQDAEPFLTPEKTNISLVLDK